MFLSLNCIGPGARSVLYVAAIYGFAVFGTASRANAYSVTTIKNIIYNESVGDRPEQGDLYLPVGVPPGTTIPAVVVIHGGEWKSKSKTDPHVEQIATTLAQNGVAAFAINYMLWNPSTPNIASWPQNLMDSKTAVQWLRVNAASYAINTDRIGVVGTSAGAQLAALVAMTNSKYGGFEPSEPFPGVSTSVQAAWLMYCPCTAISKPGTTAPFLGNNATQATETAATPNSYVRAGLPPIILIHGMVDTTVPVSESIQFHDALAAQNIRPGKGTVEWHGGQPLISYTTIPGLIEMDPLGHGFPIESSAWKGQAFDLRPNMLTFFSTYLPDEVGAPH